MNALPVRLTAADVARLCNVDIKTIHNWADKGKLASTRTVGRHLRFHRLDVIEFLRAYANPVPAALTSQRARVCIVGDVIATATRRALARRFDVVVVADAVEALVSLAAIDPDVVVMDHPAWLDDARAIERLRELEATRHVRVVIVSDDGDEALRAGATAVVPRGDVASLRNTLDRIASGVSAPRGTP